MEKYTMPKIPIAQHILEDISDCDVVQVNNFPKTIDVDERLQIGYSVFRNFMQLQEDLNKQEELKSKLNDLKQKLVDNIAIMKKQTNLKP